MAQCCSEDEYSMFQGERIAATRANIEFCKFRIKQIKAMAKGLKDLLSDFYSNPEIESKSYIGPMWKHALVKLEAYEKDMKNYKTNIEILKSSIKLMDEERQKVLLRSKKNK